MIAGRIVSKARIQKGLTRIALARNLNVSVRYIEDIEHNRIPLSPKRARVIANALSIPEPSIVIPSFLEDLVDMMDRDITKLKFEYNDVTYLNPYFKALDEYRDEFHRCLLVFKS